MVSAGVVKARADVFNLGNTLTGFLLRIVTGLGVITKGVPLGVVRNMTSLGVVVRLSPPMGLSVATL